MTYETDSFLEGMLMVRLHLWIKIFFSWVDFFLVIQIFFPSWGRFYSRGSNFFSRYSIFFFSWGRFYSRRSNFFLVIQLFFSWFFFSLSWELKFLRELNLLSRRSNFIACGIQNTVKIGSRTVCSRKITPCNSYKHHILFLRIYNFIL